MHPTAGYRRDIDGMRALAIIPVVLSHLRVPGFSGGFVGVDVFFVISGFLITGIIAREYDAGTFSLVHFYERRARRILPALLVMIAFVLAAASWLYLPGDFEDVPRSALMTLAFLGNVWFYLQSGYFSPAAETMPLLHCWSLAVEEQFYIGMPLLLWLIARWAPRRRLAIFTALTLLSFGLTWWRQNNFGGTYYFLPIGRAWELLAGALLAIGSIPQPRRQVQRELLALGGIGLIAFAIIAYSPLTPFPGIATLPPVLGTVLLLHSAPGTLVGRLLSMRLPVAIGLISYSLYLWHWPLIAFAEYWRYAELSGIWRIGVFIATFFIAWLSWRFVERPFRDTKRMPRRRIFMASGLGIAGLGLAAAAMLPLGGWESRFPPEVSRIAMVGKDLNFTCVAQAPGDFPEGCKYGAASTPEALVWGDSVGFMLAQQLGEELRPQGKALVLYSFGGCPPVLNLSQIYPSIPAGCEARNEQILAHLGATPSIKRVYLVANWAGDGYHLPQMLARFDATVDRIRAVGKSVVIIGPVPNLSYRVPVHLAHLAALGKLDQARGASLAEYARQSSWFTSSYAGWQAKGVTILDPARGLVADGYSRIIADGIPLYIDQDHLTKAGARAVLAADPNR